LGQLNLVEHTIDDNARGAASLYVCDLDRDGDMDVLAAMYEENSIVWWRNDGRTPPGWTKFVIGDVFMQAGSVFAADIDGDSLTDVLGVARVGDEVAWWRNGGGDPIAWTKYTIRAGYDFAHEVYAEDLDRDGDMDVFGAASYENEITWWRNDGGAPVAWTEQVIGAGFTGAKSVHVGDFDGDDTLDVVGAAILDNEVTWWHNGGGDPIQWTRFRIDRSFAGAHRVQAVDVDRDGRLDVAGAAYFGHEIAWWRNDGGDTIAWTKQTIGWDFYAACIAQAIDLDGDGDMDVLGTAQSGNQVAWWRNDGGQPFTWTKFVIDSLVRVWPLYACDVDGDSDVDVVAASGWNGTNAVKWYENRGVGIAENPAVPGTKPLPPATIGWNLWLAPHDARIRVRDASGRIVARASPSAGVYFIEADGGIRKAVKTR